MAHTFWISWDSRSDSFICKVMFVLALHQTLLTQRHFIKGYKVTSLHTSKSDVSSNPAAILVRQHHLHVGIVHWAAMTMSSITFLSKIHFSSQNENSQHFKFYCKMCRVSLAKNVTCNLWTSYCHVSHAPKKTFVF